jgi:DNA helicase MCM8
MSFSAVQNGEMCIRSDIHVLVVGDPGLGKSQMLRAAATLSPRAIFVCANTTTTAGLTVAVSREGSKGDVNIEAGALVLADRGVCCIDELDKMSSDPHSLLEAMEQQQISIAKSGVVTSLKSRCSILAAANPVGDSII